MCSSCEPPVKVTIGTIVSLCKTVADEGADLAKLGTYIAELDTDTIEGDAELDGAQQEFYYAQRELSRSILRLRATLTNYK